MVVDGGDVGAGFTADLSRSSQSEALLRKEFARGIKKALPGFGLGLLRNSHSVRSLPGRWYVTPVQRDMGLSPAVRSQTLYPAELWAHSIWNDPLNWHTCDGHTFRERKARAHETGFAEMRTHRTSMSTRFLEPDFWGVREISLVLYARYTSIEAYWRSEIPCYPRVNRDVPEGLA